MAMQRKKILGLTVADRSIKVAEVSNQARHGEEVRVAEFVFPADLAWDHPSTLGTAFAAFLREQAFTAGQAVIGVPVRWLVSKEKTFPSVDSSALEGMVKLEAEQSFAITPDQLVLDYIEHSITGDPTGQGTPAAADRQVRQVFMAAIQRRKSEQIMSMLETAGLQATALTPTVLPAIAAGKPESRNGLFLFLKPDHVESVLRENGAVRMLRHLPLRPAPGNHQPPAAGTDWQSELVNETRRILATRSPLRSQPEIPLFLGNETSMDDVETARRLEARLAMPLRLVDPPAFSPAAPLASTVGKEATVIDKKIFAATVALARAGMSGSERLGLDFLHSRLQPKRGGWTTDAWVRLAGAAAIPFLIAFFLLGNWYLNHRRLTVLRTQVEAIAPRRQAAEQFRDDYELYLTWTGDRPLFLEPLREVALAFPGQQRIWLTSLTVREDMQMILVGKADHEQAVLETLDRLRQRDSFKQVKMLYLRESGNETTFSLALTFITVDQ